MPRSRGGALQKHSIPGTSEAGQCSGPLGPFCSQGSDHEHGHRKCHREVRDTSTGAGDTAQDERDVAMVGDDTADLEVVYVLT